jgi:hypothetical protein
MHGLTRRAKGRENGGQWCSHCVEELNFSPLRRKHSLRLFRLHKKNTHTQTLKYKHAYIYA